MRKLSIVMVAVVGLLSASVFAQVEQSTTAPAIAPAAPKTVSEGYPNLPSAAFVHAALVDLPAGVLARAGEAVVTQAEVDAEIAAVPEQLRPQLRQNAFFIAEVKLSRSALLAEARAWAERDGKSPAAMPEDELLQAYMQMLTADASVSDAEVAAFYEQNKDAVGGQPLDDVRGMIVQFLGDQKRQQALAQHVRTLGQRTKVEVDSAWLNSAAAAAVDNPVDKARASGLPSLVDFGSQGCAPCDKLAPILADMKTKYAGRANVVYIDIRQHPILASRFGIQTIPVQIYFDKDGRQVTQTMGFHPQEYLEAKLAELGVN